MSDSSASQLNVLCLIYEGDSMIDHDPIVTNYGPFMTEEPTRGDDIDLQDQQAPLNACLDALLYQDGEARSLTQRSLDLIAASTKKLDRKHDSFIRFLRWFGHDRLRSKHISYDEVEVCEHPLHPYFIGECCRTALRHKAEHLVKSVKYYVQALQGMYTVSTCPQCHIQQRYIQPYNLTSYSVPNWSLLLPRLVTYSLGGCAWGHMGIYYKYADDANASMRDPAKGLRYLLDTESEGNVIGRVFDSIGDHYIQGNGCDQDPTLALTFYQRAVDLGHLPAYVSLSIMLWRGQRGYPADKNRALLTLLDAEKKGVSVKDDRILEKLILRLIDGLPRHSAQLLGEFKNVGELVLHYCDVLIQRGSHIGYRLKGEVYQYGHAGIAIDEAKAIAIWEEADKVGLATHYIYCHYLIPAYM